METKETLQQKLLDKQKEAQKATNEANDIIKQIEAIDNANKPKSIIEQINDYSDVLRLNNNADENKDTIVIDQFDADEHRFLQNIVRKMRICKAYCQGKIFTIKDRRYYNWYNVSSGFVFGSASYGGTFANAASASRLCVDTDEKSIDIFKKFPEVEKGIILG
jgi:hypothetical protein